MRALRVVRAQLRASIATALQYRFEFAVEGALALLWMGVTLVPLIVVFGTRESVAGWTFPEMLVVLGWFVALKGILEGTLSPSLLQVIEHVRKGTLDFVLLKPADAQLLVSLSKIEPWRMIDVAGAAIILVVAFQHIGHPPAFADLLLAALLLCSAVLVLYSIAILVVSIAFVAVRVDNLLYLFQSVFDVARWPSSVFRGALAIIFTFVLPLALMTTYPSLALLGKLNLRTAVAAVAGTLLFAAVARGIWIVSIRRYTSASS
ncbi:MAG: ABC transporter permease [Deltaproteobacteria bacterium 13_1_20CM_2_69_21]|nr:MAG: ABC transporter permease [Deltaproteobacteria bacterium 13_1_40CM_68_24]OLC78331.1 MAG: ABC transporter permease [Deltaproteobacteria bacterium 13_1_40CM_4_68_19]OLD09272.1 MAG: ABC transporter permease [Deltaproteobacteria bacterium 13_1_40CM_3_69_14]OLD46717.1 MAG: ABC transporter permease [Chloroflexi bacterium 13_1_40CM_2_68_14]OLE61855.1 MAG: ABC transporter permease [Deltaproteobacteria bacterium 13_1_20CM_2_69_21]HMC33429.1 ABC-2 family transporter protein [Myxococcales bacteriu